MTQPLSPTAQAIHAAFLDASDGSYSWIPNLDAQLAAAIRALVEAKLPEEGDGTWEPTYKLYKRDERKRLRQELLAVAQELETLP